MKVKVDYPNRPKGSTVDITGLGSFENGSSETVDDARWERFLASDSDAANYLGDAKTQVTFPYDIPKLEVEEEEEADTSNAGETTSPKSNDKNEES